MNEKGEARTMAFERAEKNIKNNEDKLKNNRKTTLSPDLYIRYLILIRKAFIANELHDQLYLPLEPEKEKVMGCKS